MEALERIVRWNVERNLPQKFDMVSETANILEEVTELLRSNAVEDMIDALCDIIVFSTGAMWKLGYNPKIAMDETLKEIESRKGTFDASIGKWVKIKNPDQYKANYKVAMVLNNE